MVHCSNGVCALGCDNESGQNNMVVLVQSLEKQQADAAHRAGKKFISQWSWNETICMLQVHKVRWVHTYPIEDILI